MRIKTVALASLCGTLAATALAQSQPADTRAQDLSRMMEIRNWQTGPSAGDAASRANVATPTTPDAQRAQDLQSMMEIRNWQSGPSSGDAAAKAAATPPAQAPVLAEPGAAQELRVESTP